MTPSKSFFILAAVLAFAVMICFSFKGNNGYLYPQYYYKSCPKAQEIVKSVVVKSVAKEARMAASLLRLHFHDCFVKGCDASLLLDSSNKGIVTEKRSNPNRNSARGFDVIDKIKSALEKECPQTVSCADILALAARDSTVLAGGPNWEVPLGRRDSRGASLSGSNKNIPAQNNKFNTILTKFKRHGLHLVDLVALSGSHTIGNSRCTSFRQRLYNQSGSSQPDSTLDESYAAQLRNRCPRFGESNQNSDEGGLGNIDMDQQTKELFLPFRVFCTRKDIHCYDVVLDDTDVSKPIVEYVNRTGVEILIVGASTRGGLLRFKAKDIPGGILKGAPDFCTVHIISKSGKISSTRAASRPAPFVHPIRHQLMQPASTKYASSAPPTPSSANSRSSFPGGPKPVCDPPPSTLQSDTMSIKSPFTHRKGPNGKPYELSMPDTDISYVSSGRRSTDNIYSSLSDSYDSGGPTPPCLSGFSDFDAQSFDSTQFGRRSVDTQTPPELSIASMDGERTSFSQGPGDDLEAEMRRLKQELKQTMEMYSTACREALTAKQKA